MGRPGIALIAVDLDGTLLTSERVLAPEGVRSLRQAYHRGVYLIDKVHGECFRYVTREGVVGAEEPKGSF